jgi:RNA polymerase sigma factor (TIGR02999 family)
MEYVRRMDEHARPDVTQILLDARQSDPASATERLTEALYPELRRLAASLMRRERAGHTLQPTALVSEAFLRLVDQTRVEWQHRAHFLGIAARVMRQVLIDHARRHAAGKRGADVRRVTLGDAEGASADQVVELLVLDDLLERLASLDARGARVVEMRVFGGLTVAEIAQVLEVSPRTVDSDWAMARMWLARELKSGVTS